MKIPPNNFEMVVPPFQWGEMAVGQNLWYHFGVGAPPILVYFRGDWDVHWESGYNILTHVQIILAPAKQTIGLSGIHRAPPAQAKGSQAFLSIPGDSNQRIPVARKGGQPFAISLVSFFVYRVGPWLPTPLSTSNRIWPLKHLKP